VRQSGGKGQYGHVVLKIEPNEPGKGFEFVDAIKGGVVPREFIPAVEKGINEASRRACWPVTRWWTSRSRCTSVRTTTWTRTNSRSRWPPSSASRKAPQGQPGDPGADDGRRSGNPEDYAGNVMGDLSSRRGMVQGMDDMVGGGKAIKAEVPLSEMFGYSTTLRSMSQGRATYTMEFKHYAEAPRNVAEAIVAARAK
jgi:elongation factor G